MAEFDTETSLRDRAMAILIELQREERAEINSAEKEAFASLDRKAERNRKLLGLEEESDD